MVVTVQLWFKGILNRKQVTVTSRLMDMKKADKSQRGREKLATILSEQLKEGVEIKKIKSRETESKRKKGKHVFNFRYRYIILSNKTRFLLKNKHK